MSRAPSLTVEEVLDMLVEHLAVLGFDPGEVDAGSRFDEDLHADSLDLVEMIEAVERDLERRGLQVHLPDEQLLSLVTVRDAAERIVSRLHG